MQISWRAWFGMLLCALFAGCGDGEPCVHQNGNGSWCDGTRVMECTDSGHVPLSGGPRPYQLHDCADDGAVCHDNGSYGVCVFADQPCEKSFCHGNVVRHCQDGLVSTDPWDCGAAFGAVCRDTDDGAVCAKPDVACPGESMCDDGRVYACVDGMRAVNTREWCYDGDCRERDGRALCVDTSVPCDRDGVCVDGVPYDCAGGFRALTAPYSCLDGELCNDSSGIAACELPGHCAPTQEFAQGEERHNEYRRCSEDADWRASDSGLVVDEATLVMELNLATPMTSGEPYALSFELAAPTTSAERSIELWGGAHPSELECGVVSELLYEAPYEPGVLCVELEPTSDHEEVFVVVRGPEASALVPYAGHRCPAGSCPG